MKRPSPCSFAAAMCGGDPSGEPLARLYKVMGGPQDGRWYWTVLFMPDGSVGNGGNGFTATGREAREACEARIPETMRD